MNAERRWAAYTRQRNGFPTARQLRRGRRKARRALDWTGQLLFWVRPDSPRELT